MPQPAHGCAGRSRRRGCRHRAVARRGGGDGAAVLPQRSRRARQGAAPSGYDPVTEVDRGIETLLREGLSARFPSHAIVGEEHGTSGPADARASWIIDPIDGTRAFISGSPEWGTLVGLRVDGVPAAGWAEIPYLGERFAAVGGDGWFTRQGTAAAAARGRTRRSPTRSCAARIPPCSTPRNASRSSGSPARCACAALRRRLLLVLSARARPRGPRRRVEPAGRTTSCPLIPIIEAAGGIVTDLGRERAAHRRDRGRVGERAAA